jgi:hypothetical protein
LEKLRQLADSILAVVSGLNLTATHFTAVAVVATTIGGTVYIATQDSSSEIDSQSLQESADSKVQTKKNGSQRNPSSSLNDKYNQLLAKDKAKQNSLIANGGRGVASASSSQSSLGSEPRRDNQPPAGGRPYEGSGGDRPQAAKPNSGTNPTKGPNSSSESVKNKKTEEDSAGGGGGGDSSNDAGVVSTPKAGSGSGAASIPRKIPEKPLFFSATPPAEVDAGACAEITVSFVGSNKVVSKTENRETIKISQSSSGKFYSDSACSTEIEAAGLVVNPGSLDFKIYFKDTKSEAISFTLSTLRNFIPENDFSFSVIPIEVNSLTITGEGEFKTGSCTGPYTVSQYDIYSNLAPAADTKSYSIAGFGSATVYSDSACSVASTSYSVTGASQTFEFYLKTDLAESLTLSADDSGDITAGTLNVKSGPSKLLLSLADPIRSGDCTPVLVKINDELGNNAAAFGSLNFALTESSNMKFYGVGDSTCAGAEITSIGFVRDDLSKTVYYKSTSFGLSTLTASDSSSTMQTNSASTHVSPRTLVWESVSLTSADTCLAVKVKSVDATGVAAPVLSNETVNLTSDSGTAEYFAATDTTCTGSAITSVTIPSGQSEVSLFVKDAVAHTVLMTATNSPVSMDAGTSSLTVGPNGLILSGATPIRAGDCTKYTIGSQDGQGNPKLALTNFTMVLSDGAASGTFYLGTDTTCTTPVTQTTLLSGTSSVDVYYKNSTAETAVLNVDEFTATLASATLSVVLGPSQLVMTDMGDILSGNCVAYTFKFKDPLSNFASTAFAHTINLTDSTVDGGFYSDAACTTAKTSYAVTAATSQVSFYYKNLKEQAATITATASLGELTAGSLLINVGPYKLTVAGNTDTRGGDCELFTVTTKEFNDNVGVVLALTSLSITDGAAAGQFFDSADTTCTGSASKPLAIDIPLGASSISFRYKNKTAVDPATIAVSDGVSGLQDAAPAIKVGPKSITMSGSAQMMAGVCSPVTITMKDDQATPVAANVVRNTTVNLRDKIFGSGSPGTDGAGSYYSDAGCTASITTMAFVAATDSSKTVYYKNNSNEIITHDFTDAAAWLDAGALDTQLGPAAITLARMAVADYADPIRAGKCIGYTVTLKDAATIPAVTAVLPGSSLTVNIGAGGTSALFYGSADSTCTGAPVTSLVFAAGDSVKNFYMKDLKAETVPVQVYDGPSFVDTSGLSNSQLATSEKIGPDRLVLTSTSTYSDLISGGCHSITITTKDAQGTPAVANALALTTINLTDGAAAGDYYSDAACTASITSTTIASASSSKVVYYKDTTREAVTLTATDTALDSLTSPWLTTSTLSISMWPATIELLRNTIASDQGDPLRAGKCIKYDVTLKDAAGVAAGAVPVGGTTLTLGKGATSAAFYSDATCTTSITTLAFAQGTSAKNFYMKDLKAETVPVTAVDSPLASEPNMTDGSLATSEKIGPDRLVLTSTSTYSDLISGGCHSITITTKDAQGTPAVANALALTTINLTDGAAAGDYYSDAACTTSITSTTIASASSSKVVYYKDTTREAVTLTATDAALDSLTSPWLTTSNLSINIWPATINITKYDGSGSLDDNYTPLRAGKCIMYNVTLKDAAGVAAGAVPAGGTTLTLSVGATAAVLYSNSSCTTTTTSLAFAQGVSSADFYMKDNTAQAVTLGAADSPTVSEPNMTDGSLAQSIGPNQYVITNGRTSISLNECRRYTITSRDVGNTNANILAATAPDTDKNVVEMYYTLDPANPAMPDAANDLTDGFFYSNSSCTTLVPTGGSGHQEYPITVGNPSVSVYFKKPNRDLVNLQFKEPIGYYVATSKTVEVGSEKLEIGNNATITGVPADIEYPAASGTFNRWGGTSTIRAGDCQEYTVYSLNSANLELPVLVSTTVTLNDQATGSGLFYSTADTTCSGAPVTSVTLPVNASSKVFHYRDLKGEVLSYNPPATVNGMLASGSGGRDPGYLSIVSGPAQLAINTTTGLDKISVNNCVPYTISAYDVQATPAIPAAGVVQATTFSISDGSANGSFYSDAACTTQVTSPTVDDPEFTIAAAGTNQIVYYKNTASELVTFTIADKQADTTKVLLGSTFNVEVGADRFSITSATTPSGKIRAGSCSLFTLTTLNAALSPENVLADWSVNLTDGTALGAFYDDTDTTCTTPVTAITVTNGTSSKNFRYKDLKVEAVTLTADDPVATPGRTAGTFALTIAAGQLAWTTAPTPIYAGKCHAFDLTSQDMQGTPATANVERLTTVTLDDGAASGKFYSDSGCLTEITQTSIANAASAPAATFYYQNIESEGAVTLSATDATNYLTDTLGALTAGSKAIVVGASKLVIAATDAEIRSGDCGAYVVQTVNQDGTLSVNAFALETIAFTIGSGSGSLYSNAGCTVALPSNQITISSGASASSSFYYKDDVAESISVSAVNAGAGLTQILNAGTSFITKERTIVTTLDSGLTTAPRGSCERVKVEIKDAAGSLTNVSANRTLNLADGAASGQFYADADTTCVTPITSFDILSGSSSGFVRYKDTVAESPTLSITDSAPAPLTMTAGTLALALGPDLLFFTAESGVTNLTNVDQNECALFKISVADSSAPTTEVNAIANILVTLSLSGGGGSFYSAADSTCSGGTISSLTILNSTPSISFRYKNSTIESVTIDTTSAGMTSGSKAFNVVAACAIAGFTVEPLISGVPTYAMTTDQNFEVKVTAVDGGSATQTCYHGIKSVGWTTSASTASGFACGESSATPEMPSESTLVFVNGVATTTSGVAKFKVPESATVSVSEAGNSGTSSSVTVSRGAICQIRLKDAPSGGGSEVTSSAIDLNALGGTSNSSMQVYAAAMDAFNNYAQDVTVVWSGTGVVTPWSLTNTVTDDSAKVIGVKSGTGVLQADYAGGGGSKTATVNITVSNINPVADWSNITTDSQSNTFLGGSAPVTSSYWKPKSDAVTAWMATGAQSWRTESFAADVRGSRANFPDSVFIVGTNSSLDIIDATTNVLWMRFNLNSNRAIDSNLGSIMSVTALNGKIFVAMKSGSTIGGVVILDFENDAINLIDSTGLKAFGTIATRNSLGSWGAPDVSKKLVQSAVYDLASVRTGAYDVILVGSEGGGSILQYNSGTLTTSTLTTANPVVAVALGSSGKAYLAENLVGIKRSDVSYPVGATFTVSRTYINGTGVELATLGFNDISVTSGTSTALAGQNTLFVSTALGLTVINEHTTQTSSVSKVYSAKGTGLTGFGQTLLLNGVDGNATIPYATPALSGPMTVEFWFNPAADISSGNYTLFQRGTGAGSMTVTLSSGRLTFTFVDGGSTSISVQSTSSSWLKGEWHHFAGVVTTAGVEMWVDGADHKTNVSPLPSGVGASASTTYIGSSSAGTQFFKGQIDDLRVSKIARYSGATFAVPGSSLVMDANTNSLFDFENRSATTVTRVSGALVASDITLGGAAAVSKPLFSAYDFGIGKIEAKTFSTNATLSISSASGWSEYVNAQNSGSISQSRTGGYTGVNSLFYYQEDSASNLDIGICTSAGLTLIRSN